MTNSFLTLWLAGALLALSMPAVSQQSPEEHGQALRKEAARLTGLMAWDTAFYQNLDGTLASLQADYAGRPALDALLMRLLAHYQTIDKHNKSRVKPAFEEAVLFWSAPFLSALPDTTALTDRLVRGFPDTYFPARVLVPDLLTDTVAALMAARYPKEMLYALRYLPGADAAPGALRDAELAAVSAPDEARQYLHYANYVNTLLRRSEAPLVRTLLDIYATYRYNSNSFFLLHLVATGQMSAVTAHETGKDREALYNALVQVFATPGAAGRYSAEEALSGHSDRYVRKLMFQRYLPSSRLALDELAVLTPEAVAFFLFRSQNLLKKKDLENLALLLKRHETAPFPAAFADWMPRDWAEAWKARLEEEGLEEAFALYPDQEFWARLVPATPEMAPEPAGIAEAIVEQTETAEAAPEPVFVFTPYVARLSERRKKEIKRANNPYEELRDLTALIAEDSAGAYLVQLAEAFPVEVMAQLDKFAGQPYAGAVCRSMALSAPLTAKNYLLKAGHPIHNWLQSDTTAPVRTLYAIGKEAGEWTRAYMLLHKIIAGQLTIEQADSLCADKEARLEHLADIYLQPGHLGAYTVRTELEYAALDFVRTLNIAENTGNGKGDALFKTNARQLYLFMLLGEQEIIGRTFRKMYDRLTALTGNQLGARIQEWNQADPAGFVRLVLHYGQERDFFERLSETGETTLLTQIFTGLETRPEGALQATISAAEVLMALNDRHRLLRIQEIIRSEYERLAGAGQDEGVAACGVLAGVLAQKLQEGWAMYAAPHYRIPDLVAIPVHHLFNEELVNIQHYYFYNDRDGLYSYRNFVRQYEGSSYNWKIEDKGDFIRIVSVSGKRVEIYANKPEAGDAGISGLEAYLKDNGLEPQIVVHRGLSTHTLKTFRKIPPSARLILDGSCGGFHIQTVALQKAPGAHMLCNRNIGTMHINDPMFKQISESIRQGRDIEWPRFWQDMEARLGSNPYFTDYIPPHKNVAALIIKAYYDVLGVAN